MTNSNAGKLESATAQLQGMSMHLAQMYLDNLDGIKRRVDRLGGKLTASVEEKFEAMRTATLSFLITAGRDLEHLELEREAEQRPLERYR